MTGKKRLTVFGATGSVGSSTLSLVREHPDKFALHALSANSDYHSLAAAGTGISALLCGDS